MQSDKTATAGPSYTKGGSIWYVMRTQRGWAWVSSCKPFCLGKVRGKVEGMAESGITYSSKQDLHGFFQDQPCSFFLIDPEIFFSVRPCIFFWIEYGNIPDRLLCFFLYRS